MAARKPRLWKSLKFRDGKIVSNRDGSEWQIGEWREVPPLDERCHGLNCCESIYDALCYVGVEVLAEVEIDGVVIKGHDKITAQRMRIIRAWKWKEIDTVSTIIHVAKKLLKLYKDHPDIVSRLNRTIEASETWLKNPTQENLFAIRFPALFGGRWYDASAAGAFCWVLTGAASAVRSIVGARVAFDFKNGVHKWIVKRTKDMEALQCS